MISVDGLGIIIFLFCCWIVAACFFYFFFQTENRVDAYVRLAYVSYLLMIQCHGDNAHE